MCVKKTFLFSFPFPFLYWFYGSSNAFLYYSWLGFIIKHFDSLNLLSLWFCKVGIFWCIFGVTDFSIVWKGKLEGVWEGASWRGSSGPGRIWGELNTYLLTLCWGIFWLLLYFGWSFRLLFYTVVFICSYTFHRLYITLCVRLLSFIVNPSCQFRRYIQWHTHVFSCSMLWMSFWIVIYNEI